jgi:Tfp pilus assembly protein PilV
MRTRLRSCPSSRGPRRRGEAGFTVIEVVIALFVLAVVLVAMLALFDATNKIARAQIHIADMQQSLRIGHDTLVRMTRMAARGWVLNNPNWKPEDMVQVVDNAGAAVYVDGSTTAELKVLPGTDVLRIRGVIEGSMFETVSSGVMPGCGEQAGGGFSTSPGGGGGGGPYVVNTGCQLPSGDLAFAPYGPSGVQQDLEQLERARDAGNDFRLLVVTNEGEVGTVDGTVADIDKTGSTINSVGMDFDPATSTAPWITDLEHHPVAMVGIVEEYALYIRENNGQPRLSMARFKPGTNLPYGGLAVNLRQDIADDVLDLQVALGIDSYTDTNGDTFITEADKGDGLVAADEWYYAGVAGVGAPPVFGVGGDLQLVRISTLARTQGRDFQYVAPPIVRIENHTYAEPATPLAAIDIVARSHHRRVLQTTINVRNM